MSSTSTPKWTNTTPAFNPYGGGFIFPSSSMSDTGIPRFPSVGDPLPPRSDHFFCNVCQENYKYNEITTFQLPCLHQFCFACYFQMESSKCPTCRKPFEMKFNVPHSVLEKWSKILPKWIEEKVEEWCERHVQWIEAQSQMVQDPAMDWDDDFMDPVIYSNLHELLGMSTPPQLVTPVRTRSRGSRSSRNSRRNRRRSRHRTPIVASAEHYRRNIVDDLITASPPLSP